MTGTPDYYISGMQENDKNRCRKSADSLELSFYGSPSGWVGLPTPRSGSGVLVTQLSASIAAGFGFTGAVGHYSYQAANGDEYGGFFASAGLSVGGGASVSGGLSGVTSLAELFGTGWQVSGKIGPVGVNATGGDHGLNGGGVEGGIGAGAWATSTYAYPVGPAYMQCSEP